MSDVFDRAVAALSHAQAVSSDFDLNPEANVSGNRTLRPAGVLIGVAEAARGHQIYLTKRSSSLKHHPGQVAFPGGKKDPSDPTLVDTALREANEEIGLPPSIVEVLGTLPSHETVTGFTISPTVGLLKGNFEIIRQESEVDEVFTVPLSHVLNSENYVIASRRWQGRMRSYYAVPYGPYYIWGATARMLRGWADAFQTYSN